MLPCRTRCPARKLAAEAGSGLAAEAAPTGVLREATKPASAGSHLAAEAQPAQAGFVARRPLAAASAARALCPDPAALGAALPCGAPLLDGRDEDLRLSEKAEMSYRRQDPTCCGGVERAKRLALRWLDRMIRRRI